MALGLEQYQLPNPQFIPVVPQLDVPIGGFAQESFQFSNVSDNALQIFGPYSNIPLLDPTCFVEYEQFHAQKPGDFDDELTNVPIEQMLVNDMITAAHPNQLYLPPQPPYSYIQVNGAESISRSLSTPSDWQILENEVTSYQNRDTSARSSSWVLVSDDSNSAGFEVTPNSTGTVWVASDEAPEISPARSLATADPELTIRESSSRFHTEDRTRGRELQIVQYGEEEPPRKSRKRGIDLLNSEVNAHISTCARIVLILNFKATTRSRPVQ